MPLNSNNGIQLAISSTRSWTVCFALLRLRQPSHLQALFSAASNDRMLHAFRVPAQPKLAIITKITTLQMIPGPNLNFLCYESVARTLCGPCVWPCTPLPMKKNCRRLPMGKKCSFLPLKVSTDPASLTVTACAEFTATGFKYCWICMISFRLRFLT